jgi:hypothetical protein
MTTAQHIEAILDHFNRGRWWIEVRHKDPYRFYRRLKSAALDRKLKWHFQVTDNSVFVRKANMNLGYKRPKL